MPLRWLRTLGTASRAGPRATRSKKSIVDCTGSARPVCSRPSRRCRASPRAPRRSSGCRSPRRPLDRAVVFCGSRLSAWPPPPRSWAGVCTDRGRLGHPGHLAARRLAYIRIRTGPAKSRASEDGISILAPPQRPRRQAAAPPYSSAGPTWKDQGRRVRPLKQG